MYCLTSNTATLVEHLKAQRLVRKLEAGKNKGKQVVLTHLIPYPAVIEPSQAGVAIRLLDFEDLVVLGAKPDEALRLAQDALLRRIVMSLRDSTTIPPPDQYLEPIGEHLVVMVDPLALAS